MVTAQFKSGVSASCGGILQSFISKQSEENRFCSDVDVVLVVVVKMKLAWKL